MNTTTIRGKKLNNASPKARVLSGSRKLRPVGSPRRQQVSTTPPQSPRRTRQLTPPSSEGHARIGAPLRRHLGRTGSRSRSPLRKNATSVASLQNGPNLDRFCISPHGSRARHSLPFSLVESTKQALASSADETQETPLVSLVGFAEGSPCFVEALESLKDTSLPWKELKLVLDKLPLTDLTACDGKQHGLLHFAGRALNNSLELVHYIVGLCQAHGFRPGPALLCDGLCGAAWQGNIEVCQHILNLSIDVDTANQDGQTALFFAVKVPSSIAATKMLIKCKANVNHRDKNGHTALFSAADCPSGSDCVDLLLRKHADPNAVSAKGKNPVFNAATAGFTPTIHILAQAGANVHHLDHKSHNPLRCAIKASRSEVALVLLEDFGAGLPLSDGYGTCDEHGDSTCLHMARERGLVAVRDHLHILKAVSEAVRYSSKAELEDLLSREPGFMLNTAGKTLLHEVALRTDREAAPICDLLIHTHFLVVNASDYSGRTPLSQAAQVGNLSVAKCLLKARADANIPDRDSRTCLFYAVRGGQADLSTVKVLVKAMNGSSKAEALHHCKVDHRTSKEQQQQRDLAGAAATA